jgi:hypothetical protein
MGAVSFETLTAGDSGRFLKSKAGRHEVKATVIRAESGQELLSVRVWIASHPGPSSSAGWSEPSRWSHTVYDDDMDIVAIGHGKRERDSWATVVRALEAKGISVRTVEDAKQPSRVRNVNPEYAGRNSQTLLYWLRYWSDETRSQDEADAIGSTRESEIAKLTEELQARGVTIPDDLAIPDGTSAASRFTWGAGDVDILTPAEAGRALGIDEDDLPSSSK